LYMQCEGTSDRESSLSQLENGQIIKTN